MTSTPAKRQKMKEDTANATEHGDTQKSYLWFDDGNVVLQAEKTLFRVHKSVLALHSEVFSDMFRLPLPSDNSSQPMFEEGCPLILLSDLADDVASLLSNIYENQKRVSQR
ncbi:hypothetical protein D9613_006677 [Agrocybe pediades]|uniref:BTB domain-containing protein n=1 Tax=Agrocybe pediades TaxID=84607 RepID=A0A8H4VK36_9AGAR|nr:hypothetical protein D9613_006677 [Agrocybe pediades]